MQGWTRDQYFDVTSLPLGAAVAKYPDETVVVYPGAVLFEGTNVSEAGAPRNRSSCAAPRG